MVPSSIVDNIVYDLMAIFPVARSVAENVFSQFIFGSLATVFRPSSIPRVNQIAEKLKYVVSRTYGENVSPAVTCVASELWRGVRLGVS